ncbi:winged helix-turn-helix domain-containing protein [Jiangella alba]|uniref:Regulatory protein, gntR family n=1 Tax=Jiangella alba TaxID=561176 RepID=A0A1H5J7N2_9ACTN|nr:winged helix-turn-helix domain-containing protein [Jiangella alba]SEE48492.1 regulatory protein, gntR family [Jiangella alba]
MTSSGDSSAGEPARSTAPGSSLPSDGQRNTIDHDHPTYVYVQLADHLRERILRGDLSRQRRLPHQVALAREYGVADWTVRRAIAVLREEGIVTVSGRGMFGPMREDRGDGE